MIELMVKIVGELPKRLLRETDVEQLNARAARKMQRAVVENFEGLRGEHFYKDAADSTRLEQHGAEAEIRVEKHGVRLRWKGGVVKPGAGMSSHTGKATKLLAIPDKKRMEAPGRAVIVPKKNGAFFLLRRMHHLTSVGDSQSNTLIVSHRVITGCGELGD